MENGRIIALLESMIEKTEGIQANLEKMKIHCNRIQSILSSRSSISLEPPESVQDLGENMQLENHHSEKMQFSNYKTPRSAESNETLEEVTGIQVSVLIPSPGDNGNNFIWALRKSSERKMMDSPWTEVAAAYCLPAYQFSKEGTIRTHQVFDKIPQRFICLKSSNQGHIHEIRNECLSLQIPQPVIRHSTFGWDPGTLIVASRIRNCRNKEHDIMQVLRFCHMAQLEYFSLHCGYCFSRMAVCLKSVVAEDYDVVFCLCFDSGILHTTWVYMQLNQSYYNNVLLDPGGMVIRVIMLVDSAQGIIPTESPVVKSDLSVSIDDFSNSVDPTSNIHYSLAWFLCYISKVLQQRYHRLFSFALRNARQSIDEAETGLVVVDLNNDRKGCVSTLMVRGGSQSAGCDYGSNVKHQVWDVLVLMTWLKHVGQAAVQYEKNMQDLCIYMQKSAQL